METKNSKYYQGLSADMKIRYDEKILKCMGIDPYSLKEKELSDNRIDFPEITLIDIANHMIHSVSPFSKKQFKNYKGMEAYSFFESGFVLNVGSRKLGDTAILSGRVKHSQRMNEPAVKVWILAKMNGEIICAHCTCLAGLSETCSHVGALCYAVVNVTESAATTSVTDVLCKWNVPKLKESSMSEVANIKWRSTERPTTSTRSDHSFLEHLNSIRRFDDEVLIDFINAVYLDGHEPALRTILFPDEKRRKSKIPDEIFLSNIYSKDYFELGLSELVEIGKSIKLEISDEDRAEINRVTLSQRKSKFWIALRRGRVTGSNLKDCCVTNISNPSITTVSRVINPLNNLNHIPSVKYGLKNKEKAIRQYQMEAIEDHQNFEYKVCGLIFNQKMPYFTDSTDGLVYCDCHGEGCVEIKCMKVLEVESFEILTVKPNNILNKFGNQFFMECSHEFFYKVQMCIHMSQTNYCDFMLWSSNKALTIRINSDLDFWEMVSSKALTFHEEVIMPELLGKFFTKAKESRQFMYDESAVEESDQRDENSKNESFVLVGLEIEMLCSDQEGNIMKELQA